MSRRPGSRMLVAFVPGMLLLAPAVLSAQAYTQQVQNQMRTHSQSAINAGYTPVTDIVTASLNRGASGRHAVSLNAGRRYVIIGVCDNDCTDIDLKLYGPDGSMIIQDVAVDDYPTLQFVAPSTGQFSLEVVMAACSTNPCFYGIQLFGGASNSPMISPTPMGGQPLNQPTPMNQPMPMNQPQPLVTSGSQLPMLGTIGANQQVMGNLGMNASVWDGKPIQTWGFQCGQGQTFQMDILSSWDNYGIVFDPAGIKVADNDDAGGNNNARIIYTCAIAGIYRLGITTYSTSITPGAYTLQVQSAGAPGQMQQMQMNQPQPLNSGVQPVTQAQAMPLPGTPGGTMPAPSSTGMQITGSIAAPGQVATINTGENKMGRLETGDQRMNDGTWADVWTFQGRQGQHLVLELRSEEFDTYLQLLDGNGNRLAEDDDSLGDQNSKIEYNLPTTGMYTIVVNNFGDDRRAGIYTLSVR